MAKAIIMPQVGQDIESAIISEWLVKEKDKVEKGDIIATVESDKAAFEVETFESSIVLKLLYKEQEEARVLEPIAYIGEPGENLEDIVNNEEKLKIQKFEASESVDDTQEKHQIIPKKTRILSHLLQNGRLRYIISI
jgi:pyruvate/2-oxoglutarate dehydrogenase complex dihydrolipoamide acyltransferase (E2) component